MRGTSKLVNRENIKSNVRRFGRVIKSGVKSLLTPLRNYNIEKQKLNNERQQDLEDMMAGRERVKFPIVDQTSSKYETVKKGRSSSDGRIMR